MQDIRFPSVELLLKTISKLSIPKQKSIHTLYYLFFTREILNKLIWWFWIHWIIGVINLFDYWKNHIRNRINNLNHKLKKKIKKTIVICDYQIKSKRYKNWIFGRIKIRIRCYSKRIWVCYVIWIEKINNNNNNIATIWVYCIFIIGIEYHI